jgi:hypothetical protein
MTEETIRVLAHDDVEPLAVFATRLMRIVDRIPPDASSTARIGIEPATADDGPALVIRHAGRPESTPPADAIHLGDGCYAAFDGYCVWLWAERENGWHRIALEPTLFQALLAYARQHWSISE